MYHAVKGQEGDEGSMTSTPYPQNYTAQLSGNWNTSGLVYTWFENMHGDTAWGEYGEGMNINTNGDQWLPAAGAGISGFPVTYQGASLHKDGTLWQANDTGSSDHVHITVIDGKDGCVATANYYMTIHRQYEVFPSNRQSTEIVKGKVVPRYFHIELEFDSCYPLATYEGDGSNGCSAVVRIPNINGGGLFTATDAVNVFLAGLAFANICDLGVDGITVAVAAAIGEPITGLLPPQQRVVISFDECWGADLNRYIDPPGSTYRPSGASGTEPFNSYIANQKQHYVMIPHWEASYAPHWHLLDIYDSNGFLREDKIPTFTYVNGYPWGEFREVGDPAKYCEELY